MLSFAHRVARDHRGSQCSFLDVDSRSLRPGALQHLQNFNEHIFRRRSAPLFVKELFARQSRLEENKASPSQNRFIDRFLCGGFVESWTSCIDLLACLHWVRDMRLQSRVRRCAGARGFKSRVRVGRRRDGGTARRARHPPPPHPTGPEVAPHRARAPRGLWRQPPAAAAAEHHRGALGRPDPRPASSAPILIRFRASCSVCVHACMV